MGRDEFTMHVEVVKTEVECWDETEETRWFPVLRVKPYRDLMYYREYLSREAIIEAMVDAFRAELEERIP